MLYVFITNTSLVGFPCYVLVYLCINKKIIPKLICGLWKCFPIPCSFYGGLLSVCGMAFGCHLVNFLRPYTLQLVVHLICISLAIGQAVKRGTSLI